MISMQNRADWDEYFLKIAFSVSERSTCDRLHVGAVIVKDNRIKSTGYNGSPPSLQHCTDDGCYMHNKHCIRTIHAEANAIMGCSPEDREGATIYVTDQPCPECQKLIIASGIKRIVYARKYPPETNWFESSNIKVEHIRAETQ